jgi:hypothetical protein
MRITVTHRLDDTCIEKAWKHAEMEEIEDLAAGRLGKAQEAQSISSATYCIASLSWLSPLRRYCGSRIYLRSQASERRDPFGRRLIDRPHGDIL